MNRRSLFRVLVGVLLAPLIMFGVGSDTENGRDQTGFKANKPLTDQEISDFALKRYRMYCRRGFKMNAMGCMSQETARTIGGLIESMGPFCAAKYCFLLKGESR